jgi:hypothetical protein
MKTASATPTHIFVTCPECGCDVTGPRSNSYQWGRPDCIRAVAAGRIQCNSCGAESKPPAMVRKLGEV